LRQEGSGGRHVDETEIPQDENLEVDVVALRDSRGGVGNPKVKTERSNQLLDDKGLCAKTTKDFTAQQRRREESAAGRKTSIGGRIRATTPGHETLTRRRKRGFSFKGGIIALRARGRKQGQCRPRLWGRHLHGSMVRAHNLLMRE
jgi:hypothetical protein